MWITPKTNWRGEFIGDVYVGDKFNATDFNRIKNNLSYLCELAVKMYDEFTIHSLGSDRTPKDYFYADEINKLEENLNTMTSKNLIVWKVPLLTFTTSSLIKARGGECFNGILE